MTRTAGSRLTIAASCLLLALLSVIAIAPEALSRQRGSDRQTVVVRGVEMTIYTYRPTGCVEPALLFVFHGNSRTASNYLEYARPLADRACFLVFAPLFDEERFPSWSYHRGGIVNDDGVAPREEWTVNMVAELVSWARIREGRPDAPYYLFGHSAGGQFLSRVAAFAPPSDATRIVIANPSSYVMPSLDEPAPYGFGRVFDRASGEAMIRRYLQLPVTIYLGAEDTGDEDLLENEAALRQGENRFVRGEKAFEAAKSAAKTMGVDFAWKLVVVPGVGHSTESMLGSDLAVEALGLGAH